jgi:hypothetical protein
MSLEKQVELLVLFKKNMIEFLDELLEQFEDEGDLIVLRFFIEEQIPVEMLMNRFVQYVYPMKVMVKERNEKFFLERDNIFGSSPKDKVIHFKQLFLRFSDDDKATLWTWFDVFISLCEKYMKMIPELEAKLIKP